jgi:phosphatidylinositol kinase/protein kinase (PI-3  family)
MMKLFEMCVQAWQEAGLDLKLRLYACMSTTANSGIIQVDDLVGILMFMSMIPPK